MQQKEKLYQLFSDFQRTENIDRLDLVIEKFAGVSAGELYSNLAKISMDAGDSFLSLYFFYRALFENYFVKHLEFFNKSLFNQGNSDFITQGLIIFKSDFSVICSLLLVIIFCLGRIRTGKKISKGIYGFSIMFVVGITILQQNLNFVLVRDKTSFLTDTSTIFDTGQVTSGNELFLKTSEDELFYQVITSNLNSFWVRKKDAIAIR